MEARLKPAVARILDELRSRPKGIKKMSARRLLRAFGYERRSQENVREIRAELARARIEVNLAVDDPKTLDELVTLRLRKATRALPVDASDAPPAGGKTVGDRPLSPLPTPAQIAQGRHRDITDVIAAVKQCTVQIFTEIGEGSGVIVDPNGLILTNRHVVDTEEGLSERYVHVHFADGTEDDATVVRSHRPLDYALLVVPRQGLCAVPLGDPLKLKDAQTLYAIGNPGGLAFSVTRGIVSAARRVCTTNVEYIQTDAAINAGSSGGPVVTEQGDLVGISAWAYRGDGRLQAQGINFAIPVDYMREEIRALRAIGFQEACRRYYCRHCGWLEESEGRYCSNCGAARTEGSER
ncbi:MAG TPA: S1C family serine protease [Armatimonadota bacterium]|jgi:S1-C subfamily serine protease|nr:serine protease [Armatimonadota bacterium]HOM82784.1 S1C family serine protease [Armatimonadota bacterium]HOQ28343.1 S1C family serine protease [Armatimonadota bacterium]HPO73340.1 S1C family serine protease [Armatimonadota bacterium]HPT98148.1 S1C family serine protease [Armatimonadota bacterium]